MILRSKVALLQWLRYCAVSALLAVLYYGAARLGLRYASIGQSISLMWPPTGIAIAALTMLGVRYWPAIAIAALLANAATPVPLTTALAIATGNTLEALVASSLLRRTTGSRPQLDDIRHVRTFLLTAAPLGTLCSAVVGSCSLWLSGLVPTSDVPLALVLWWTGDLLGALVVAPLVFAWTSSAARHIPRRLAEVVLLCVGTVAAGEVVLGGILGGPVLAQVQEGFLYVLFPFVLWAALRFGARGASLMTFTLAAVAVGHTVAGGGPFVTASSTRTLLGVTSYLAAVSVTGLVLAAAVRLERDQATAALAASEERLRRALDAARMGVWVWSVETNTLVWDDNLRRLYGLDSGERIASYEDFLARIHPDDRELVGRTVRQALEAGGDLDYEFRIVLPDGKIRWIADHGEIRRSQQGRPIYMTGICTDVTEHRVAEERLRQAHRMETVGRLAGGVAHETNNQMSVVLGASEFILRRTDVPEPVRADVEFIQKAAERTATITSQLLAFSRRQILQPEVLEVNAVILNWEPVLRRIMGEDCDVALRLAPDVGRVRADPGQLEQVLLNLALNARDAMPRGGRLSIETFPVELTADYARTKVETAIVSGIYVVVAVSDTGYGMDKETLSHVFEPFFTTKGLGQGTGLGLSTVYGIVRQSDGYIWVYSEPGQGTTFKIYLPVQAGEAARSKTPSLPPPARAGECILIVEDELPVRYMMKRALEDAGYGVVEAGSAAEALQLVVNSHQISLILADVIMPGQNGRELADQIAELRPGIPVLFTSGYTDAEIERRELLKPGAAFLQKPVTPDGLIRAIQRQLEAANRPAGSEHADGS